MDTDIFTYLIEEMRHGDDEIRYQGRGYQNIGTCDKRGKLRDRNEPASPKWGTAGWFVLNFRNILSE